MTAPRSRRRIYPLVAALTLVVGRASAEPTPEQKNLARSLFDAGREALLAGRYAESCAQFAESQRIDPQAGTQLNLAICHVREGKTGTAWVELREAKTVATKGARADRVALADEELKTLEPRLQRLVVAVPPESDLPELQIAVDGVEWRRAAWGIAAVLDPGRHTVRATAPGRAPFEATVTLSEEGATQRFSVPPLADAAQAVVVGEVGSRPKPREYPAPSPFAAPRKPHGWTIAGNWSMVAGGTIAVVAGAASVVYLGKGWCRTRERGHCPEQQRDDMRTARGLGWASVAGLGIFGAGVVMVSLAPYPKEQRAPVEVQVRLEPGGASLTGAF